MTTSSEHNRGYTDVVRAVDTGSRDAPHSPIISTASGSATGMNVIGSRPNWSDASDFAAEELTIKNMSASAEGTLDDAGKNVKQKTGLNRSIRAQTCGILRQQLTYKAAWAGRELVVVDPKFTSQRCSGCGAVFAEHRQGKRYECADCGMIEYADVNAALNILHEALTGGTFPVAVSDAA